MRRLFALIVPDAAFQFALDDDHAPLYLWARIVDESRQFLAFEDVPGGTR